MKNEPQISWTTLYVKQFQTLLCPQSVICGRAWGVSRLGLPHDPAPAEVCRRLGLQTTEGALESALPLSGARAIHAAGHHYVTDGYAALLTTRHSFYNKLENSRSFKTTKSLTLSWNIFFGTTVLKWLWKSRRIKTNPIIRIIKLLYYCFLLTKRRSSKKGAGKRDLCLTIETIT